MPFLRSRAATLGASFFDFNSFNPHASMHVVLHIYGSLDVQTALNSKAPYDIVLFSVMRASVSANLTHVFIV